MCSKCPLSFSEKSSLFKHFDNVHEKKLECHVCYVWLPIEALKKHMKLHEEKKTFKCPTCHIFFSQKLTLKNHDCLYHDESKLKAIVNEEIKKFKCSTCQSKFASNQERMRHVARSHKANTKSLDQRGPKGKSKNTHKKKNSGLAKLYRCAKCPKIFENQGYLETHFFQSHSDLSNQERIGHVARSLKASTKSLEQRDPREKSKSSPYKKNLGLAILYRCTKCPGLFETQEYLETHFSHFHGNPDLAKLYNCEKCPGLFGTKEHLDKHFCQFYDYPSNQESIGHVAMNHKARPKSLEQRDTKGKSKISP